MRVSVTVEEGGRVIAATVNRNQDASPPFYGVNDANPPIGLTFFLANGE